MGRIELSFFRTKAVSRCKQVVQSIGDAERLWRRMHRLALPHEKRVGELRAQTRKHLADLWLCRLHRLRGAGNAAPLQQGLQHAQVPQVQVLICGFCHILYSYSGIAEVLARR